MTIECYYGDCPHHSIHDDEEGPFCFMPECAATQEMLDRFALLRQFELWWNSDATKYPNLECKGLPTPKDLARAAWMEATRIQMTLES